MTRTFDWRWLLGYFVLAMLCWGMRPLWDPDEGRYAEASREFLQPVDLQDMTTATLVATPPRRPPVPFVWRLDLGKVPDEHTTWGLNVFQTGRQPRWLYPHLQGQPHLTKPPLTYWITAIGLKLWGINAWGARFFVGLAFFATILCVVGLARMWGWNIEEARAAGLIYATAALPFAAGHLLTTDTLLTLWETLLVLACWRAWTSGSPAWRMGFWIAIGLAFLTKGPPGCLPLLAVLAFYFLRRKQWRYSGRICSIASVTAGLALALAWFLVMCIQHPFLWNFYLGHEVVGRVTSTEFKRNNPFYIYPPVLIAGFLPWIGFYIPLVRGMWRRLRSGWSTLSDVQLFSLLWFWLPFIMFTLSKSRLPLYVLPLCAPLALWFARLWVRWCGGVAWPVYPNRRRIALGVGIVWGVGMLVFTCYPAALTPSRTLKPLAQQLMKSDPTARYQLFSDDYTNQTLTFYTGRRLLWMDRNMISRMRIIDSETTAGRPSAILLATRNYKKAMQRGGKFQVLAKDRSNVIIAPAVMPKFTAPGVQLKK